MQTVLEVEDHPPSNQSSAESSRTSNEGTNATPSKAKSKRSKANKHHGRAKPKATVKIRSTKAAIAKFLHPARRQIAASSPTLAVNSSDDISTDAHAAACAPAAHPGADHGVASVASSSSEGSDKVSEIAGADASSSKPEQIPEQPQIAAALSSRSGIRKSTRSASNSSGDQTAAAQSAGPLQQGWSPRSTGIRPSQAVSRSRRSLAFDPSEQRRQAVAASTRKAVPQPSPRKHAGNKAAGGGRRSLHADVLTFEQFQVHSNATEVCVVQ